MSDLEKDESRSPTPASVIAVCPACGEEAGKGPVSCGNCGLIRGIACPPVPPATHPGELYVLAGGYVMRGEDDPGFLLHGDASGCSPEYPQGTDLAVLRRLVHCRNLVDGPEEYAEHYEEVEHPGLDADIAAACGRNDERLARRIVERMTAYLADYMDGHAFDGETEEILAVCREEIARWAEPDDQDAPPARPDALLSPEDAGRGGE